jgi:hypothetical protein
MKEIFIKNKKWIALIWTIINIVWSLYIYYNPSNQNPDIKIILKNITNVFEINDDNKDLKIFFKEKDVLKEKLSLKVVTLKIMNDGNSDVSTNNFDTINEPFGLSIKNGVIINAEIDKPSIKSFINIQNKIKSDSSNFIFKPFIFPKKQYFFVRMTILHSNKKEPVIQEIGRIVNADINWSNNTDETSTDWLGLSKLILIFIIGGYFITKVDFIYDKLKGIVVKKRRQKILEVYKLVFDNETKYKEVIKEMYGLIGKTLFKEITKSKIDKGDYLIKKSLENSEIQSIYLKAKEVADKTNYFTISTPTGTIIYYVLGDNLKKHNCYIEQDGKFFLKEDFYTEIDQIIKFFENP